MVKYENNSQGIGIVTATCETCGSFVKLPYVKGYDFEGVRWVHNDEGAGHFLIGPVATE